LRRQNSVLLKTRIPREILRNAAFDLIGQASMRTTDHALDVAATRLISAIQDATQNAPDGLTNSSYCIVDGAVPFHASAYRQLKLQLQTKLNDGPIERADSQVAQPACFRKSNCARRARPPNLDGAAWIALFGGAHLR
jgi:hypothetical protein